MSWQAIEIGTLVPGFLTDGGVARSNVVDSSMYSGAIPVIAGESLLVAMYCPANMRLWERHQWYDPNGTYISDAYYSGSNGSTVNTDRTVQHELTVPSTAAFIKLSATQLSADGVISLYRAGGGCFHD